MGRLLREDLEALLRTAKGAHHNKAAGERLGPAIAGGPEVLGPSGLMTLQRLAGNAAVTHMIEEAGEAGASSVKAIVGKGGGRPLDEASRSSFERGLGQDLSTVRVHTGPAAARSAKAVGASAYTVGEDIVLGGAYNPTQASTRQTLAHELTHVVQQRNGPVDGSPAPGGIKISDPGDRFERQADETAQRIDSERLESVDPVPSGAPSQSPQAQPTIQRRKIKLSDVISDDEEIASELPDSHPAWKQWMGAAGEPFKAAWSSRAFAPLRRAWKRGGKSGASTGWTQGMKGTGSDRNVATLAGKATMPNKWKNVYRQGGAKGVEETATGTSALLPSYAAGRAARAGRWAPSQISKLWSRGGKGQAPFGEEEIEGYDYHQLSKEASEFGEEQEMEVEE